jgi:hypothetical protein
MRIDNPEDPSQDPEIVQISVEKQVFVQNLVEEFAKSIVDRENGKDSIPFPNHL